MNQRVLGPASPGRIQVTGTRTSRAQARAHLGPGSLELVPHPATGRHLLVPEQVRGQRLQFTG